MHAAQHSVARRRPASPFAGSRDVGRSKNSLQALDGCWVNACPAGSGATLRWTQDNQAAPVLAGCRDVPWLPATSSFASCGKRSRLSDEPDQMRRGSSFPIGRSKTTSFLSSRCTPFVTFCNFKCFDCVNHVQFFPTKCGEISHFGNCVHETFCFQELFSGSRSTDRWGRSASRSAVQPISAAASIRRSRPCSRK